MSENDNRPPADNPRAASVAAIGAATQNIANMLDEMRDMATKSISLAAQIQLRVDELKNVERR